MTNVIPITDDRDDVAAFAAWSVGSFHGDWDPKVDAERVKVMNDDRMYLRWRREYRRYRGNKAAMYEGSDVPPELDDGGPDAA